MVEGTRGRAQTRAAGQTRSPAAQAAPQTIYCCWRGGQEEVPPPRGRQEELGVGHRYRPGSAEVRLKQTRTPGDQRLLSTFFQ